MSVGEQSTLTRGTGQCHDSPAILIFMPPRAAPDPAFLAAVRLRPVVPADLPAIFQMQLDPEGNQMAMVKPRDAAAFHAAWEGIFADPRVVPRVIVAGNDSGIGNSAVTSAGESYRGGSSGGGGMLGVISCFQRDGLDYIGYWIEREHWGKGLATRALALLLHEVTRRPLYARVAATNPASLRVLTRNGFTEVSREWSPGTDRLLACEEVILKLT